MDTQMVNIGSSRGADRLLDVVFIHGLGGDAISTWTAPGSTMWPVWLSEDLPDIAVWSVGFDAAPSTWLGHSMPLEDRATNMMASLGNLIGDRPICFIAHSLGGLLVKEMLFQAYTSAREYLPLMTSTAGVIFLATPHSGSTLASLARFVKLGRISKSVETLTESDPHLLVLRRWYNVHANRTGLAHLVFVESHRMRGLKVVTASSADPVLLDLTPIPIDADHSTLAKVPARDSVMYRSIDRFLRARLEQTRGLRIQFIDPPSLKEGMNDFRDLEDWLESPLHVGVTADSFAYNVVGRVLNLGSSGTISVRILTDRWYEQGNSDIDQRGNFRAKIYLDRRRMPMVMQFVVRQVDGREVGTCLLQVLWSMADAKFYDS